MPDSRAACAAARVRRALRPRPVRGTLTAPESGEPLIGRTRRSPHTEVAHWRAAAAAVMISA